MSENILYSERLSNILYGERLSNILYGERLSNILYGEHLSNILYSERLSNILYGEHLSNILYGERLSDILYSERLSNILYSEHLSNILYSERLSNTVVFWTQASQLSTNLIRFILLFVSVSVLVPIHTNKYGYLLITVTINHLTQHLFTEICNQLHVLPILGHPEALYNYLTSQYTTVNVTIL